jgi:hypothetical protein
MSYTRIKLASEEGIEPPTYWLTASRSTAELLRNISAQTIYNPPSGMEVISVATSISSLYMGHATYWCRLLVMLQRLRVTNPL